MAFHETRGRTLTKAITFRALIVASDVFIIYAITQSLDLAFGVILFSNVSSTFIYIFHERGWNKVHWGKTKKKPGSLLRLKLS